MIVLDLSQEHQTGNSTLATTTATATTLSDLLHATGIFPENEESSLEGFENQTPRPPQQILLQPREVAGGESNSLSGQPWPNRADFLAKTLSLTLS